MYILVVDDDEEILRSVSTVMSQFGIVETCYRGKTAIKKLENKEYNLVLLDYHLPDTEGNEIIKHVKSMTILMTGERDPQVIARMIDSGIVAFLPKPFTKGELINSVERVLCRFIRKKLIEEKADESAQMEFISRLVKLVFR